MRVFKRTRAIGGKVREDKKHTVEFRDHLDTVRRLVAFTDEQQSRALAERIEKLVTWARLGGTPDSTLQNWLAALNSDILAKLAGWSLVPAEMVSRDTALTDHLESFIKNLTAQKNTPEHCSLLKTRIRRVLEECRFAFARDIKEEPLQNKLGEWQAGGLSQQTVNHYIRAMKQFTRWMKRHKHAAENPLEELTGANVESDRRLERRELSGEEIVHLLEATRRGPGRSKLTGPQRAMLYAAALGTGLRASELASLTARSFKLTGEPCTVCIAAPDEKARRGADLPLPADLVVRLKQWLPTCPAGLLWPGKWADQKRGGKMLKEDLAAARAAWLQESKADPEELARRTASDFLQTADHDGKVADFHALRHTYLSRLGRSGAPAKVMQMLARHSTVELTLTRYTHANLVDLAGAVAKLPSLEAKPAKPPEALRATGTNPKGTQERQNSDPLKSGPRNGPFLGTPDGISCHQPALSEDEKGGFFRENTGSVNEESGLENRSRCKPTQGSNPCLSAAETPVSLELAGVSSRPELTVFEPPSESMVREMDRFSGQFQSSPDLKKVVEAWPNLPPAIRRAVLALVDSCGGGKHA